MTGSSTRVYAEAVDDFLTGQGSGLFAGASEAGVNAFDLLCSRHISSGRVALRWMSSEGRVEEWTFAALHDKASRFADMLIASGVRPGDRVAGLLPRRPDLLTILLGALKAGCVYQPLFTAFGPRALDARLEISEPVLVVTDQANRPKLDGIFPGRILNIDADAGPESFAAALDGRYERQIAVRLEADAPFLMMFTSGTTGKPKGVLVPIHMLRAIWGYMRYALDLRPEDRFWNLADPGWAYGLYYGICGPLLLGQAVTLSEASFSVERTYDVLRAFAITNFAGAPTAYRAMVNSPLQPPLGVRLISSAGETLDRDTAMTLHHRFGCSARDHWGQTELGMVLCDHHGLDHPRSKDSIGYPSPGWSAAILDAKGDLLPPGEPGYLAVDRRSPLFWFGGYFGREEQPFAGDYYLTGDMALCDPDGAFHFIGRDDDVITSSGYRIGPTEVEGALLEHPAVAEAAVIGRPDPVRTETVKAFVRLKDGETASDALGMEIAAFVKQRLAAHAYPREVEFVKDLPKTPSGKVQRYLLRQLEMGRSSGAPILDR